MMTRDTVQIQRSRRDLKEQERFRRQLGEQFESEQVDERFHNLCREEIHMHVTLHNCIPKRCTL